MLRAPKASLNITGCLNIDGDLTVHLEGKPISDGDLLTVAKFTCSDGNFRNVNVINSDPCQKVTAAADYGTTVLSVLF